MEIFVRRATAADQSDWLHMRKALWNYHPEEELAAEQALMLANPKNAVFLVFVDGAIAGMLEASLRDYGEGCHSSPVGYIEGWFVYDYFRGKGAAGALVSAAEDWARGQGCAEMASDTWLGNDVSVRAHNKLGYQEVERLIHFAKRLYS